MQLSTSKTSVRFSQDLCPWQRVWESRWTSDQRDTWTGLLGLLEPAARHLSFEAQSPRALTGEVSLTTPTSSFAVWIKRVRERGKKQLQMNCVLRSTSGGDFQAACGVFSTDVGTVSLCALCASPGWHCVLGLAW